MPCATLGIGNNTSKSPPNKHPAMTLLQKILLVVWMIVMAFGLGTYFFRPEWFTVDNISHFIATYKSHMLLVYFLISISRGIFLIPSTPFVIAGAILFADDLWTVLFISMVGVMAGSAFIFFFTEFLGVDQVLEKKFGARMARVKQGMEKYGFWIVIGWSFFPIVPTDLVSYTAGLTRMKPWKFLLGVFIGELPLVTFYIFSGQLIGDWVR
jgi:uncharacterized membrane protein YdjX (TVP38/TMEM64 family)